MRIAKPNMVKPGMVKPGQAMPPRAMPSRAMPPRGMPAPPPRGMPPRGDTGTNIQKVDYAAQNAAGPGRLGNYGSPPNLPPQLPKDVVVGFPGGEGGKTAYSNDPPSTRTYATRPPPGVTPPPSQGMPSQGGMMGSILRNNMPPPSQGMPSQGMGNNIGSFLPKNAAMPTPQAMGGMGMKKGGKVSSASSSASSRADGCATKGKTKGRFV